MNGEEAASSVVGKTVLERISTKLRQSWTNKGKVSMFTTLEVLRNEKTAIRSIKRAQP